MKEMILTRQGLKKLEDELSYLKTAKRREVAARLKQSIEFGDLSENSEYEGAKNEQAFIEGRILTLEKMLRNSRVVDHTNSSKDKVNIGSTVSLRDIARGKECQYTIVSPVEADPTANKISYESPVGKAILGQRKGSVVEVKAPAGKATYEILDIF
ncbi:MAG TPA: transcription elongation factor GreA [Desulfotomaculum sp.]|jgi:transcription elongation factor GreA|nr:transcription elongation factor GreA [Desulfotomaculum sp.]